MTTIKRKRRKRTRKKGHYVTGTYESKKGGSCKYRSGWELSYLRYLDDNNDVESFKYEGLVLPYISNIRSGKIRKYFPDILVCYADGTRRLVEIKPSRKLDNAIVKKKIAAAEQWCKSNSVTFEIITEKELKHLNLL